MYTNETRKSPARSSWGQQYQVVANHIDINWTLIETTKRITAGDLITARRRILQHMQEQGVAPKHQVLDNYIPKAYKAEILDTGMTFQMELPDNHQRNIAEKSIQTWKDYFIGVMSGTATTFPMHLWCQAIPQ